MRRFLARNVHWIVILVVVALIGVAVYAAQEFFSPHEITFATGQPGGAYYTFAQQYQKRLAEEGYTLTLRPTVGVVKRLELLRQGEVDAGLVQTFVVGKQDVSELASLGSLFYQPLWIFYRTDQITSTVAGLADLKGLRVSIGEGGSGTPALAQRVLNDSGITSENTTLVAQTNAIASEKLRAGDLDATLMILAVDSNTVQQLAAAPNIGILSIDRAPAYQLHYDNLAVVTVPEGAIDLPRNLPHEDKTLLAVVAMLVVRKDLPLKWERLLLTTAHEVHGKGALLEKRGEFPSSQYVDIPISPKAEALLNNGYTGLNRWLPLWLVPYLN